MAKSQSDTEHALPSLALVFGYIAVKDLGRLEDRIAILARFGYGISEIATICDASPSVVRTLKSRGLRSNKKGAKK